MAYSLRKLNEDEWDCKMNIDERMNEVKFEIFEKNEVSLLSKEWINLFVFGFLGIFWIISEFASKYYPEGMFMTISAILFCVVVLIMMLLMGMKFFRKRKIDGDFNGSLIFSKQVIEIKNVSYMMNEISKLEFYLDDYEGKIKTSEYDLNPALSTGIDNEIKIHLKNGKIVQTNFQIAQKYDFLKMRELLIEYYLQNKISFLRLIQLLRIQKYEDIQEFKKSLPSIRPSLA